MMFLGRVAAVSYLNTIPFIYGIEHAGLLRADLLLSPPAANVRSFLDGEADIALVPVGALADIPDARIITSFCIGASGPVRTVVIVSRRPIDRVGRVWLDSHSRTSALLAQVLFREWWNVSPEFRTLDDYSVIDRSGDGDAFMLIGDKVFDREGQFPYSYDLAECWHAFTGLPFVFAVWIARDGIPDGAEKALQRSFEYGMAHIGEAVAWSEYAGRPYAEEYLRKNIDFIFDGDKSKALSLFRDKAPGTGPGADPG